MIRSIFFVVLSVFALTLGVARQAEANPRYASIVIDADSGMILHERYADKKLHPASLVKMMTLLMTFEAIERGQIRLHDRVVISRHASSMVPSKLDLPVGSTIRVEDAVYALVTKSANDVAVALAEHISGTESQFARDMTRRAAEIGLRHTRFYNASGLHHRYQISTARDMARLAQYILHHHKQYYHYFGTKHFSYRGKDYRNHNRLMSSYRGMDGFKTGYINAAGFNLVASARRDGRRLIGVVFGGRTARSRNAHMEKLLDNGFARAGTMMAAYNSPPPPPRKPFTIVAASRVGQAVSHIAQHTPQVAHQARSQKWASLSSFVEDRRFREYLGQGDYDPAAGNRFETGLIAIAAVKGQDLNDYISPAAGKAVRPQTGQQQWSIQVGAFTSRVQTDRILKKAQAKLPGDIQSTTRPLIVPLRTPEGWLFRARLGGLSENDAHAACNIIPECIPVAPQSF